MNKVTVIACVSFAFAMAVETLVWVAFLHRLRTRHPQQWLHASQPVLWQHRTLLSARSTMLYLHNRNTWTAWTGTAFATAATIAT